MKSCDFYKMSAGSQDTAIQLDPVHSSCEGVGYVQDMAPCTMLNSHRTHSRSQSWSLSNDSRERSQQSNYSPNITSVYSISPLTNVIREFVPSFVNVAHSSDPTNMHLNRTSHLQVRSSSTSSLSQGPRYGREEAMNDHLSDVPDERSRLTHGDASLNMDVQYNRRQFHEQVIHETTDQSTLGVEISEGVRWMERNAVFIILLLFKFSFYHRYGLMIILGMFVTYFHSNQTIRRQVALKNRRQISILILTVLFLAGNIYFVYYVFWDQKIYNCLYFQAPNFVVDLMNLLWSIWVTDYIIRFATMALKALVAAFFVRLLPSNKKGKYYMLLEYFSQLYRNIVPLPLWVRYLSDKKFSGIVFAVLITATYLMIKGVVIFLSLRDLYRAVISVIKEPLYGSSCSREELMHCGYSACPICQEDFDSLRPVTLICRHIFCEDCVLQWLDRQNSCPLCRATVPNHNPKWRDGSTATWPQLF